MLLCEPRAGSAGRGLSGLGCRSLDFCDPYIPCQDQNWGKFSHGQVHCCLLLWARCKPVVGPGFLACFWMDITFLFKNKETWEEMLAVGGLALSLACSLPGVPQEGPQPEKTGLPPLLELLWRPGNTWRGPATVPGVKEAETPKRRPDQERSPSNLGTGHTELLMSFAGT